MPKLSGLFAASAFAIAACAQSPVATSPSPSAYASPTAQPTAATPPGLDHAIVYLARDRLPPVGRHVAGAGVGATAEARIRSRLDALWVIATPLAPGEANVARTSKARLQTVKVDGDLATIDFSVPNDDWGLGGSAALRAFVQQLIYTASEEPGIKRVLITQNGGKKAIIGGEGLEIGAPGTRETVMGYALRGSTETVRSFAESGFQSDLSPRVSVDEVAPGMARFVVELRRRDDPTNKRFVPDFTVEVLTPDQWRGPELGKWILKLSLAGGSDSVPGLRLVGQTPLRAVWTESAVGGEYGQAGTSYYVGLDDLRPWRVGVMYDPARIVLDVGGHPDALAAGTAVYAPKLEATVERTFITSGMARAFEANVQWRVRDAKDKVVASGHTTATLGTSAVWGAFETKVTVPSTVSGNVTLEVYQASAKDGSDTELVRIPLRIAP